MSIITNAYIYRVKREILKYSLRGWEKIMHYIYTIIESRATYIYCVISLMSIKSIY